MLHNCYGSSVDHLLIDLADFRRPFDRQQLLSLSARRLAAGPIGKTDLARYLGVSRPVATSMIDRLLRCGVAELQADTHASSPGRPAEKFSLSKVAGTILIADFGARTAHLCAMDLQRNILAEETHELEVFLGAQEVIPWLIARLRYICTSVAASAVRALVVGLPVRVSRDPDNPIYPSSLRGWDSYPVAKMLRDSFACPVIFENDANLLALGRASLASPADLPLVAIKVATGIGSGIVAENGMLFRGADGAAGEIGHIPLRGAPATECRCGNVGCVEAFASVPTMARQLGIIGPNDPITTETLKKFITLVNSGDSKANSVVRGAAKYLGEAASVLCNTLNPRTIVIFNDGFGSSAEFLATMRSVIYKTAPSFSTHQLQIEQAEFGDRSGFLGAAVLGLRIILSPEYLRSLLK